MSRTLAKLTAAILARPVEGYITWNRDRLALRASPLGNTNDLRGYFSDSLLNAARIVIDKDLMILPSVIAITFDNVIAAKESPRKSLLFHELVHVVQSRNLGVREFSRQYVFGYVGSGSYWRIPLETHASLLEARFLRGERFDAEKAVADWLASEGQPDA